MQASYKDDHDAKTSFYSDNFISADSKEMHKLVSGSIATQDKTLPDDNDDMPLPDRYASFFHYKTAKIRSDLDYAAHVHQPPFSHCDCSQVVESEQLRKLTYANLFCHRQQNPVF